MTIIGLLLTLFQFVAAAGGLSGWRPMWDAILKNILLSQTAGKSDGFRWEGGHGAAFTAQ